MRLFKTFNAILLHDAAARMSAAESSEDTLRGLLDLGLTCQGSQDTRSAHRIVGGTEAQPATWPWIVRFPNIGCAGSIIGPRTVVTAAHCCFTDSPSIFDFVAGKHSRIDNFSQDPFTRRYRASAIRKHRSYTSSTFESDICLVFADEDIQFNDAVQPVCLPSAPVQIRQEDCYVAGWGRTSWNGFQASKLLEIPAIIYDVESECNPNYRENGNTPLIDEVMICAGNMAGGIDACQGDSGGPLVCLEDGVPVMHGIVSWGVKCAMADLPGVYTRTSAMLDWIEEQQIDVLGAPTTTDPPPHDQDKIESGLSGLSCLDSEENRIMGGQEATYGSWPFIGRLEKGCAATIIGHNVALTAAHCCQDQGLWNYDLNAGVHHSFNTNMDGWKDHHWATKVVPHPDYDLVTKDNDICLIFYQQSFNWSPGVQPACLPSGPSQINRKCHVAGWGSSSHTSTATSSVLMEAQINIYNSTEECQPVFSSSDEASENGQVTDNMICAGWKEGGVDACSGDTGGPLVCVEDGKPVVTGIVSWGFKCGIPNFPSLYTDVSRYTDWIAKEISESTSCDRDDLANISGVQGDGEWVCDDKDECTWTCEDGHATGAVTRCSNKQWTALTTSMRKTARCDRCNIDVDSVKTSSSAPAAQLDCSFHRNTKSCKLKCLNEDGIFGETNTEVWCDRSKAKNSFSPVRGKSGNLSCVPLCDRTEFEAKVMEKWTSFDMADFKELKSSHPIFWKMHCKNSNMVSKKTFARCQITRKGTEKILIKGDYNDPKC